MWKVIKDLYTNPKPKSCMQDLCLEKLMCRRAQGKVEFLGHLRAKYTSIDYCVC